MITKRDYQKRLGERIVEIREKKGITQSELARKSFKDRQNIYKLEIGGFCPNVHYLLEIATALEMTLPELLEGLDKE